MRLRICKELTRRERDELSDTIIRSHGDIDKLKQRAIRSECRRPGVVDEYMVYCALTDGANYRRERISISMDTICCLTPGKIELLEYLYKNDADSISDLADAIEKDYKNVYDDVRSLEKHGIISLKKEGKNRKPILEVDKIIIDLG